MYKFVGNSFGNARLRARAHARAVFRYRCRGEGTEVIEDSPLLSPFDTLGNANRNFFPRGEEKRTKLIKIHRSRNERAAERDRRSCRIETNLLEKLVFARRTGTIDRAKLSRRCERENVNSNVTVCRVCRRC